MSLLRVGHEAGEPRNLHLQMFDLEVRRRIAAAGARQLLRVPEHLLKREGRGEELGHCIIMWLLSSFSLSYYGQHQLFVCLYW